MQNLRCGETAGTDFATREMESVARSTPNQRWFRMNLLRHTGLMVPDDVADEAVTAVTLPRGHQYSLMEVMPARRSEPLPETLEEWGMGVAEKLAPR